MKNVIFMINVIHNERSKSMSYNNSIKSWQKWATKNNAELFILDSAIADIDYMLPQWYKMYVFDLLDNSNIKYNKILYVDSDTFVHPDMPNVFSEVENDNSFIAVRNFGSMDWVIRSMEIYSHYIFNDYRFPIMEYFNSGFFIIDKSHRKMFDDIKTFYEKNRDTLIKIQKFGVGKDQPVLNFFVQLNKNINLKLFPYEYNMQSLPAFELLGDDLLYTKFGWIYHFNAGCHPSPGYWIDKTFNFFYGSS